jgi:hypothetical protein
MLGTRWKVDYWEKDPSSYNVPMRKALHALLMPDNMFPITLKSLNFEL